MILVEAKYFPFLLMSFQGVGHSEAEYRAMFTATEAVGRRALHDRTRYVTISVSSGNMSAGERKLVAELSEASPKELETICIRSYVVSESALFRGVLTALRWISPKLVSVTPVSSVDAAIEGALSDFREHRIPIDGATTTRVRQWLGQQVIEHRRARAVSP